MNITIKTHTIKKKCYDFALYFALFSLLLISGAIYLNLPPRSFGAVPVTDAPVSTKETTDEATDKTDGTAEKNRFTVVIDAGHGGEDGGAVGAGDVYEKDLNLSVATEVCRILRSEGIEAVLTRTEDRLMYSEEQNIKGQRKAYDLKNRYLIASEYPNAVFISIHMNKFPQTQYKGLQVYYSPNHDGSRELAGAIQTNVRENLQPDNERKTKRATSSIYLLDRLRCPAVLVECGFLSNTEDLNALCDKDYQHKLAFLIAHSVIVCFPDAQISDATAEIPKENPLPY